MTVIAHYLVWEDDVAGGLLLMVGVDAVLALVVDVQKIWVIVARRMMNTQTISLGVVHLL